MNKQEIIERIESPERVSISDGIKLKQIVTKYPFFHAAQLLYLKSLSKSSDNSTFENQLRLTAAQSINRKIIFELLKSQESKQETKIEKPKVTIKEGTKPTEGKKSELITETKKEETKAIDISPEPKPEKVEKAIEKETITETKKEEIKVKKEPDKSKDLLEQVRKRLAEIEAEKKVSVSKSKENHIIKEEKSVEAKSKEEIIDDFIKEEPRIKPRNDDFSEAVRIANKSNEDNGDFISDTLAEIYVKQGNKEKGIEIYKKLSLKYPEKSSYFAAQIKKAENKLRNNK